MKKGLLKIVAKIKIAFYRWVDAHTCRVLIDGNDNSVSRSKGMVNAVGVYDKDIEGALIVRLCDTGEYAIVFKVKDDPKYSDIPRVSNIQYNCKYKSIGFESLTPMVTRILNDYGLPILSKQSFAVKHVKNKIDYWVICRKK